MAAFAKVELTEDARLHGEDYKASDVLRVDTTVAQRLVKLGKATPYTGQKRPANEPPEPKEVASKAASKAKKPAKAKPEADAETALETTEEVK